MEAARKVPNPIESSGSFSTTRLVQIGPFNGENRIRRNEKPEISGKRPVLRA